MTDVVLQANLTGLLLEGDESGWVQMLVFAVVIGLSAVSSFAKQRKHKRQLEQEEQAMRKPAQPVRRQVPSRAVQQRPAVQGEPQPRPAVDEQPPPVAEPRPESAGRARPRTIIRPSSALSAFVAEIKQEIKRAADEMQGVSAPPRVIAEPKAPIPPRIAKPILEPEQPILSLAKTAAKDEIQHWPTALPGFSGPADLKRAILYYEILGKPLSMRGPSEQIIGL